MGRSLRRVDTSPGRVNKELARMKRTATEDRAARGLEASEIGSGGLRVRGGNVIVDEGGNIVIAGGDIEVVSGAVIAGAREGRHAQFGATGYLMTNATGGRDVDITTDGDNRILLVNPDGRNILLSGGTITGDAVNTNSLVINGESIQAMIARISKSTEPDDPPPSGIVRRTLTRTCDGHQCYNGAGNPIGGPPTQGYSPYSQHGNQRSMLFFPDIAGPLSSATSIIRARLHIFYAFWHAYSGGTAVIGYHGRPSDIGTFTGFPDRVREANFPRGAWRWIDLPQVLSDWGDGDKKGITLGPGPSTSTVYYGEARGAGSAVLEIIYEEPE